MRLGERFGNWGEMPEQFLWFHGASAGEMNGLKPLISSDFVRAMRLARLASVLSATGLEAAKDVADQVRMLPFDNRVWLRRALGAARPKAFIFGETELWPELLEFLYRRGVPRVLVNARLTEGAYRRYRQCGVLFRPHLERLSALCAAEARSAEMFRTLGVPSQRIEVTGNAKYDLTPPTVDVPATRAKYFPDTKGIVVLGSIRPGEEEYWFPAIKAFAGRGVACDVVVAPRHKEKFDYFAESLGKHAIPFQRWSAFAAERWPEEGPRVLLLDTFGHLLPFYAAASVAFIGATLVAIGGHNPLEAAMFGVPVAVGRHTYVVTEVCEALQGAGGLIELRSSEDCKQLLERVANADPRLTQQGALAQSVWSSNRGATQRILQRLERVLREESR